MGRAVFIRGRRLDLVCLTVDDAPLAHRRQCDMEIVWNWGSQPFPVDLKSVEERLATQHKSRNSLMLGIQRKKDEELVGMGGLSQIEWPWQRGELTLCIGEAQHQGKGLGREATMLILDHAFTKFNLHSVMLRVISYNKRAIACYEACGFTHSGKRREARIDGDRYYDVLYMDMLANEFKRE